MAVTWAPATCPALVGTSALQEDLAQSMDGRVTGCLRVPVVPASTYYVALQDVLNGNAGRTKIPTSGETTSVPPPVVGPRVALSVSPRAAAPGESVKMTGVLATPLSQRPEYANFCWDGCSNGLVYSGVQLSWSSASTFSAQLVLPAAPWVESSSSGAIKLMSPLAGNYLVGVECLEMPKGCSLGGPEGQATVRLRSAARYTCQTVRGCGTLTASPLAATPGTVVEFSGYAPLQSVIGSRYPFAFQLSASTTKPGRAGAVIESPQMTVGPATLKVLPALAFQSLGRYRALSAVVAGDVPISANPADPAYVGWCAGGHITVHGPEGNYAVPVSGAMQQLARTGAYQPQVPPRCDALALGPTPGSLFASFAVQPTDQVPVFGDVALFTTDAGRKWSPVPVPAGSKPVYFGGFRHAGDGVEALFSASTPSSDRQSEAPLLETFLGDGHGWTRAAFACPAVGPCITFGAHVLGNCAQGLDSQSVIASADHGARWMAAAPMGPFAPAAIQTCSLATLVAISPRTSLLVASNTVLPSTSPFDILLTSDGGRSWHVVALPPLPAGAVTGPQDVPPGPGDLVVLNDGALLAVDQQTWYLLVPGSGAWCPVRAAATSGTGSYVISNSFAAVGHELWWLTSSASGPAVSAHQVRLEGLGCSH